VNVPGDEAPYVVSIRMPGYAAAVVSVTLPIPPTFQMVQAELVRVPPNDKETR
jgi:hypothetical protein